VFEKKKRSGEHLYLGGVGGDKEDRRTLRDEKLLHNVDSSTDNLLSWWADDEE
jgi:hypothetical protein